MKSEPRKKNWIDTMVTMTATTADEIQVMEVPFVLVIIHNL